MTCDFHPAARQEVEEAFIRLDEARRGLGAEFLQEFSQHIERIIEDPSSLPLLETEDEPGVRRSFIRRFKYLIIFQEMQDRVLIVAVAHSARRPGYWKRRLNH